MYGVYNMEMLERCNLYTVHALHSRQTMYENVFTRSTSVANEYYSQMHGEWGIHHISKKNISKYTANLFHNFIYMWKQLEF